MSKKEIAMDRRGFFKTMLVTPLFTPLLLASKTTKSDLELFLIADDPQLFISLLLKELKKHFTAFGRNFTLLNSYPRENELKRVLTQLGWKYVQKPAEADLTLSFSHLRQKALPSFTLVREGRIWDIRSRKLYSLWKEMNKNHKPSSCLTIASFRDRKSDLFSGEFVNIYKDGRKIGKISLKKNVSKSFRAKEGKISIKVENGKAWVFESSCNHKICLYTPPASLAGERIICAPNHFLLEIQGTSSVDTIIGQFSEPNNHSRRLKRLLPHRNPEEA